MESVKKYYGYFFGEPLLPYLLTTINRRRCRYKIDVTIIITIEHKNTNLDLDIIFLGFHANSMDPGKLSFFLIIIFKNK